MTKYLKTEQVILFEKIAIAIEGYSPELAFASLLSIATITLDLEGVSKDDIKEMFLKVSENAIDTYFEDEEDEQESKNI